MSKSHRRRKGRARTTGQAAPLVIGRPTASEPPPTDSAETQPVERRGRKWMLLRATIIFVAVVGLFYVGYSMPELRRRVFAPNLRVHAAISGRILNALGYHVHVNDRTIESSRFAVSVQRGCDAAEPTALFIAAVIAFPAPLRRKLSGIVAGVAALQALNLLRVVSLFCTGVHFPAAFELMHIHVWQTAFILAAVILWALWAWWATAPPKKSSNASV